MKYAKMLALAAVAAGALMAFIGAGTASATVLCSTTIETCPKAQDVPSGTTLDFSLKETTANLTQTNGESIDKCSVSTVKGKTSNTGSATETVSGPIEVLTWESCTFPTKTISLGKLEVHKIAGTSNGTVTQVKNGEKNTEVTINTILFGSCIFSVESGTSIGDLKEGNPATFVANAVATKVTGGAACPTTAKWSATYTMTEPKTTISVSEGLGA
jgi:hypothetical protein